MLLLPNCKTAEFTHIHGDANIKKKAKGEIVTVDLLGPLHDKSRSKAHSNMYRCVHKSSSLIHNYETFNKCHIKIYTWEINPTIWKDEENPKWSRCPVSEWIFASKISREWNTTNTHFYPASLGKFSGKGKQLIR